MNEYLLHEDTFLQTDKGNIKVSDLFNRKDEFSFLVIDKDNREHQLHSIVDVACKKAVKVETETKEIIIPRECSYPIEYVGGKFVHDFCSSLREGSYLMKPLEQQHNFGTVRDNIAFIKGVYACEGYPIVVKREDEHRVEKISQELYMAGIEYTISDEGDDGYAIYPSMTGNCFHDIEMYDKKSAVQFISGMLYVSQKEFGESGALEKIIFRNMPGTLERVAYYFSIFGVESRLADIDELCIESEGILELVRMGIIPASKIVGSDSINDDVRIPVCVDVMLDDIDEKFGDIHIVRESFVHEKGIEVRYRYDKVKKVANTMGHFYLLTTDAETIIANNFIM